MAVADATTRPGPTAAEPPDRASTTEHRLLEAAGQVFAEQGYRAGTVREICTLAGANLAAVNYHFGDKEGLYKALLTYAYEASLASHPPDLGVHPGDPPAHRLHAFVRSFLLRLLDEGRSAWHARLMCRELHEPSPVLAEAVRGSLKRVHDLLKDILRDVAAEAMRTRRTSRSRMKPLSEDQLTCCAMSVAGQCLHYRFARPILDALYPRRFGLEEVDALAAHITAFTLGGVQAVVEHGSELDGAGRSAHGRASARSTERST